MIAKTKANSSFRGTTKYVVEKAKAKIIGGNMIGTSPNQLVAQFMGSRNLNPKVKELCYHLMLIERLAQKGIMAEVSYHSNGQVRGIRFSINVGEVDEKGLPKLLSMTGTGLNRHFGVDFNLERDVETLAKIVHSNSQRKKAILAQPTEKSKKLLLGNQDNLALWSGFWS